MTFFSSSSFHCLKRSLVQDSCAIATAATSKQTRLRRMKRTRNLPSLIPSSLIIGRHKCGGQYTNAGAGSGTIASLNFSGFMSQRPAQRLLPFLLVLFVGSGCSALIYEIVWFQLLQLVIGSSALSLGVLLATFMGGMCIGSLVMPRILST